jgi:hypothetical protein
MAIRVTMTIALRDDNGVVFGTLTKVSDRHLQAEADAEFREGQLVEFQFALEGRRTSVQGQAAVIRVVPHELPHGPTTFALKIVDLAPGKEVDYREWLYDLAHGGGTSARPHRDHASSISSTISNASERRSEGERRLAAIERAKVARRTHSVVSSIAGGSASAARDGVGRQALRNALRGFAVRSSTPESAGADGEPRGRAQRLEVEPIVDRGPRSTPGASASRPPPRLRADDISVPPSDISRVSGRGAGSDQKRQRLDVRVRLDTDPPRVEARFLDSRRYLAQYRDHLDRDVLFLRHDDLDLALGRRVRVRILLPTDDVVLCDATVGASLPSGTGFVLQLDDGDRSLLRRTAAKLLRDRK